MKELKNIQSELKAPKGQYNSFGKYHYRSAEDILEAVKPLLSKNNCIITITDEIVMIGTRYYIKATATISNSEGVQVSTAAYAREAEKKTGMDESQITGAASSYARKYALNGLLCIDDTKDADSTTGTNIKQEQAESPDDNLSLAINEIRHAKSKDELLTIYNAWQAYQSHPSFRNELTKRKAQL